MVKTLNEQLETLLSQIETMEILEDEGMMAAFRQGVKEMEEGKMIPREEVKKESGWE